MKITNSLQAFRKAIAHWGWREYLYLLAFWAMTVIAPYIYGWGTFSFFILPFMLALIPILTYVIVRVLPHGPKFSPHRKHVIEFYTIIEGRELHGKISHIDGFGRVMWLITEEMQNTVDAPLTDGAFRVLWNSLRLIGSLQNYTTNAPVESFDLTSNYFIGIGFTDQGQTYMGKYLIPHDCKSKKIMNWIKEFMSIGLAPNMRLKADGFAAA
jgi:hypothetical protein